MIQILRYHFETLYFQDGKFVFVYETNEDYDEQDDRGKYFHKFQTVEQLKQLLEKYYLHQLECKTKESHEFFIEKYSEPDGTEIEQLVAIREWETEDQEDSSFDKDAIQEAINEEFKSSLTPMALYTLGDHTMEEIIKIFFSEENQLFDVMQSNANEL